MKIYARSSLVMLVACSAAGTDDLFPTAVTVLQENPAVMTASEPEAPSSSPPADPPIVDTSAPALEGDGTPPPLDTDIDVPGAGPDTDDVAPSLRATYPTDGEAGVTSDTAIVIEFSEAMDRRTTRAALRSTSGPIAADLEWHDGDRELHLEPTLPLAYAAGDAETPALTYVVDIADGARDAAGNTLQAQAFSFQTLRQVTQILLPVASSELTGSFREDAGEASASCAGAICVGDDGSPGPRSAGEYRGFLSFDLTALPAQQLELVSARIRLQAASVEGDPFGVLGELRLERATFDAVGPAAFEATPQATFAAMTDPALGATGEHILWAVQADFENEVLHQYRLNFDRGSNQDGASDLAIFAPEAQQLEITYLLP